MWSGYSKLIGKDRLIDPTSESLLRLISPVLSLNESYLCSDPILELLTSHIEIVFNHQELLDILMTVVKGILSKA